MPTRRADRNQLSLHFSIDIEDIVSLEGSQETLSPFEMRFRTALRESVDRCGKREAQPLDRFEIAARMSRALGREITKGRIDNWTAFSAVQYRMHIDSLRAICEVMQDWAPLHYFIESCGFKALNPVDANYAEYGAMMALESEVSRRAKQAKAKLDSPEMVDNLIERLNGGKR